MSRCCPSFSEGGGGGAENDAHEIHGPICRAFAGHEIARRENAAGRENTVLTKTTLRYNEVCSFRLLLFS